MFRRPLFLLHHDSLSTLLVGTRGDVGVQRGHCTLKGHREGQLRRNPGPDVGVTIEDGRHLCQCISYMISLISQYRLLRAGKKLGNLSQGEVGGSGSRPCLVPQESMQERPTLLYNYSDEDGPLEGQVGLTS